MIKYNHDYAKPDENGYPLYAPFPEAVKTTLDMDDATAEAILSASAEGARDADCE